MAVLDTLDKYIIVQTSSIELLVDEVNLLIGGGYEVIGGIEILHMGGNIRNFMQVLVRK